LSARPPDTQFSECRVFVFKEFIMAIAAALAVAAVALMLATIVEGFTEFIFGHIVDNVPSLEPWRWVLVYIALAAGVGLALIYRLDLIAMVSSAVSESLQIPSPISESATGYILSGLMIGRGANWLHDFLTKYLKKPDLVG
jgi:hypothetical protein